MLRLSDIRAALFRRPTAMGVLTYVVTRGSTLTPWKPDLAHHQTRRVDGGAAQRRGGLGRRRCCRTIERRNVLLSAVRWVSPRLPELLSEGPGQFVGAQRVRSEPEAPREMPISWKRMTTTPAPCALLERTIQQHTSSNSPKAENGSRRRVRPRRRTRARHAQVGVARRRRRGAR